MRVRSSTAATADRHLDEPAIGKVRERLKRVGLHPFPLPLGVDIDKWLKRAKTPWDAFPDTRTGKMDAETCGLAKALAYRNVELRENARVERLLTGPDGKRIGGVEASIAGDRKAIFAGIVILAAPILEAISVFSATTTVNLAGDK